ncbi:MAG: P-II family nitrogen regulator [Planctomycetes bacterium]|nr:P-II family nitrogen regulator [Planctomycetota bacterium]
MKLVVAVIRPFKAQACLAALRGLGISDVYVCEARGYGRQKDHLAEYKDDRFAVAFLPKVRLEFAVLREKLKEALNVLMQAARTGRQGDGKIWIQEASPGSGAIST